MKVMLRERLPQGTKKEPENMFYSKYRTVKLLYFYKKWGGNMNFFRKNLLLT